MAKRGVHLYKTVASLLLLSLGAGCGSGAAIRLPSVINDRTVFLGDSITAFWQLPKHNAGIPGETTAQIQARFQTAVIESGLQQVILLAGANDVRTANPDYSGVIGNIEKMVEQGRAAGIEVILCEITPISCCDTQVRTLNAMIKDLATAQHLILVDYYTPMAMNEDQYLKDGLHPNSLGYAIMENTLTQTLLGNDKQPL
jgi:acyl-CoA thioesterase I